MSALGWVLCALGTTILLIAALGLLRLPDALSRQHAATKAGTLGVTVFALGAGLIAADPAWTWRLAVMVVALLVALPLASHALARAAVQESRPPDA
ncbi:MAG: monovalent cation/H(+) antiporter subunit G [Gammaproteobacteria bacterium]